MPSTQTCLDAGSLNDAQFIKLGAFITVIFQSIDSVKTFSE